MLAPEVSAWFVVVPLAHRSSPFWRRGGQRVEGGGLELEDLLLAVRAELAGLDLVVELEDRVDEHLRARRAAGEVHVDGDDVVDALDDRVVVEHAARATRRRPSRAPTWARPSGRRSGAAPGPSSGSPGRPRSSGRPGAARPGRPPCRSARGRSADRRTSSSRWRSRPGRTSRARTTPCGSSRRPPRRCVSSTPLGKLLLDTPLSPTPIRRVARRRRTPRRPWRGR